MDVHSVQSSRSQVAMHNSHRLQPLRILFLVIIFIQLYVSNSVSLPSICGILLTCVMYTVYIDSKGKETPDIQPLPSPCTPSQTLPTPPAAVVKPDLGENARPDDGCDAPSLPSQTSSIMSLPEVAPFARDSDDGIVQKQPQQQEQHSDDSQQQERQQPARSQELPVSAAPWKPSSARTSSGSLYGVKSISTAAAAASAAPSHPPTSTVFVGNMSSAVTENDLFQMFVSYGDIIVARIQRGTKQKGLKMCAPSSAAACTVAFCGFVFSRTFNLCRFIGFIDFYTVDSAVAAVRALQGVSLCGRPMRLEFSQVGSPTISAF